MPWQGFAVCVTFCLMMVPGLGLGASECKPCLVRYARGSSILGPRGAALVNHWPLVICHDVVRL
jgi:hypothetical protein